MKLVKAKCTSCGGDLDVNPDAECLICKYCGSPFIVEKAINNYNTTINNTIVNNIKADTVVIQDKNIDALIQRGMAILSPATFREGGKETSKDVEISDIARAILAQDSSNFYAHLFLIDSGDYNMNNFSVCEGVKTEKEQKIYIDYIADSIDIELRFLKDRIDTDIIHLQMKGTGESILTSALLSLNEMSKSVPYAQKKKNEIEDKIGKALPNLINHIVNEYTTFFFSKDTVKSYEFEHLEDLVLNFYVFSEAIKPVLKDEKIIHDAGNKIINVLKANQDVIMQGNQFAGRLVFEYAYKLIGKDEDAPELSNLMNIKLSGSWSHGHKVEISLFDDRAEVNVIEDVRKTIYVKDILFLNLNQMIDPTNYRGILGYDLVFRVSETQYSLVHFVYSMGPTEDFYNCEFFNSLNSWAIQNDIKTTRTKYENVNPFENGYNGMTFVKTHVAAPAKAKGCYVATCVYNSYDCPEVWRLRRYRDNYLDNHWFGRLFIKIYYKVSPTLVRWFGNKNWFRKPIKRILDRKIKKLAKKGYEDTPYNDKY